MLKLIKPLFFFSLCFVTTHAYSQRNFQQGYLVTNKNDTLKGYIRYNAYGRNPKTIVYRAHDNDSVARYGIDDIDYFEVPGENAYLKSIVWKDMSSINLNSLSEESEQKVVKDTVLLRYIVKGDKVSLFELIDDKTHFFIKPANDTIRELLFKRIALKGNPDRYSESPIYREQLKQQAASLSSDKALSLSEQAKYSESDLKKVVLALNGETEMEVTQRRLAKFYGGAGITLNSMKFTGENKNLSTLGSSSSVGYTIVAGLDLYWKKKFQRFQPEAELRYNSFKYDGSAEVPGFYVGHKQYNEYRLSVNTASISAFAIYNFYHSDYSKFYLGGGFGYNFSSYPTNVFTETDLNTQEKTVRDEYLKFEKSWGDLLAKLGYIYDEKVQLNLLYRIEGSFANFAGLTVKNNFLALSLHYRF